MSSTDYAKEHAYAFRAALVDLLRIPSISTQTAHAPDVERAAQWLIEAMTRIGMTARAYQADGYLPIVYGEWLARVQINRPCWCTGTMTCSPPNKATVG